MVAFNLNGLWHYAPDAWISGVASTVKAGEQWPLLSAMETWARNCEAYPL